MKSKMFTSRRYSAALMLSIICHLIFFIILAIFLHTQKVAQVSSFVETDIFAVDDRKPMRRYRRMPDATVLNEQMNIHDISQEMEVRPKMINPDVQLTMRDKLDIQTSFPSTAAEGLLRQRNDYHLAAPVSATSRRKKRSRGSDNIAPRRVSTTRVMDFIKPSKKTAADDVGDALLMIADHIAGLDATGKADVVFVVDASGSMDVHIRAVANHLSKMAEIFVDTGIDYTFGVIKFNRIKRKDNIEIWEQTRDVEQCKKTLRSIKCDGDERALDAIAESLSKVKFREGVHRTFVLVTNEKLTGKHSIEDILAKSAEAKVKIHVIGFDDPGHKTLADQTGGLWFPLPQ